jgi:hypothetical protein
MMFPKTRSEQAVLGARPKDTREHFSFAALRKGNLIRSIHKELLLPFQQFW